MSYSVCIACDLMVPGYEKYCARCLKRHPHLKQDENFWRTPHNWEDAMALAKKEIGSAEPGKERE